MWSLFFWTQCIILTLTLFCDLDLSCIRVFIFPRRRVVVLRKLVHASVRVLPLWSAVFFYRAALMQVVL